MMTVMKTQIQQNLSISIAPEVPKDFVTSPIFPARKQIEPRELMVGDVKWTIGVEHPTKRRVSPALDMRHARACFTLLSFRDQPGLKVHFSMNDFCRRYASSQGGRYSRDILNVIFDLQDTWIARTLPDGTIERFTILEGISISERVIRKRNSNLALTKQYELWLDYVTLNEKFFSLLTQTARIRIDVLNSIRTPLVQAIYSFIPSRAVHHNLNDPFEITATKLLEQLNETVPDKRADRKKKFANKRDGRASILEQLDGIELINGKLRVDITETTNDTDWKLLFWVEDITNSVPAPLISNSKLLDAFITSGRGDKRYFDSLMKSKTDLNYYHTDMLATVGIKIEPIEEFLTMVKAIIGNGFFEAILAEVKSDILEGNIKIENPAKLLNYRLIRAIKNQPEG